MKEILYCSGYWIIENNNKNSKSHYIKYLPKTLKMLKSKDLIFYYKDQEIISLVKKICKQNSINLTLQKIEIEQLPFWTNSKIFLENCKNMTLESLDPCEKGSVHYFRDLKGSGEDVYRKLITIWMSKVNLMGELSRKYKNKYRYLAWVDSSISRFNYKRSFWNFINISPVKGKLIHYKNHLMKYKNKIIRINASFLLGDVSTWKKVEKLFESQLLKSLYRKYGHDEETILHKCYKTNEKLFLANNSGKIPFIDFFFNLRRILKSFFTRK